MPKFDSLQRRSKRFTQKDIARDLAISYITVQRAMKNSGYVSKNLKQKILEYAREVGYTPHRAAQALVKNKITHIALFSSDRPRYFWDEVKNGVNIAQEQIAHFNYSVSYHLIPQGDTQAYCEELDRVKEHGLDALGIVYQTKYDMPTIMNWIRDNKIPLVLFNVDSPTDDALCYIGSNYFEGGMLAAEYLAKACRGNGCIGIINYVLDNKNTNTESIVSSQRQKGFMQYLREKYPSMNYNILYLNDSMDAKDIYSAIESFLTSHNGVYDGLYFVPMEHDILVSAIEKLGLGKKMIVVCHDLYPEMEDYLERELISAVIYQNPILQGYYTVRVLENYLETGQIPENNHVYINNTIVMNANKHVYRNTLSNLFSVLIQ